MEKAWDLKELGESLKAAGLPIAETATEQVVELVLDWCSESCVKDDKSWNDMGPALIPLLKSALKPQLDKIDGVEG